VSGIGALVTKLYSYVGPAEIRARVGGSCGTPITSREDLFAWVASSGQRADPTGLIGATFVIDAAGVLRIADRRSEHVACAGGGPVQSAGEMFFLVGGESIEVVEVSNQSTGYCPEPESWPSVAAALDPIGMEHPGRFTGPVIFRRCIACGERNIVKDGCFVCAVCGADLPGEWNLA
jgi:hypothetical protein